MNESPFVTVIVPCRNEAAYIERALWSILDDNYSRDKMEVLVIDGRSTDRTREIVKSIASKDKRVRLLDNPAKIQAAAMNIGLKNSKGDIFIRIDGHAEVSRNFIKNSVDCLLSKPEAWVVGGAIKTIGQTYTARAISNCMKSPIGVGNSRFRIGDYEGWVDTLAFGTHHKWILEKVGYFDEQLSLNEDDEFNLRILRAGGKIWLSKSICSTYYARGSLKKLWHQYFRYGFARIETVRKHKRVASFRQLVPLLFVISLISLAVLGFVSRLFWWLLFVEIIIYVLGLLYGAVDVGVKAGFRYSLPAPFIFAILHFGYGLGCMWGFIRFIVFRGKGIGKAEDFKLSR